MHIQPQTADSQTLNSPMVANIYSLLTIGESSTPCGNTCEIYKSDLIYDSYFRFTYQFS